MPSNPIKFIFPISILMLVESVIAPPVMAWCHSTNNLKKELWVKNGYLGSEGIFIILVVLSLISSEELNDFWYFIRNLFCKNPIFPNKLELLVGEISKKIAKEADLSRDLRKILESKIRIPLKKAFPDLDILTKDQIEKLESNIIEEIYTKNDGSENLKKYIEHKAWHLINKIWNPYLDGNMQEQIKNKLSDFLSNEKGTIQTNLAESIFTSVCEFGIGEDEIEKGVFKEIVDHCYGDFEILTEEEERSVSDSSPSC